MLRRDLEERFPQARLIGGDQALDPVMAKVVDFVEAPGQGLDLPLDCHGTAFQQRVWQALREIPAGATASYAEIAERIGAPKEASRWARPARPTPSRSRFPATASCARTVASPATAGASNASGPCSSGRRAA